MNTIDAVRYAHQHPTHSHIQTQMLPSLKWFLLAYPARPIRMIIPFPPGGSIDTVGRVVSQLWGAALGWRIAIDNRGGVGGALGTEMVARATPDGYTLLYTNAGSLAIAPHMNSRPNYDD